MQLERSARTTRGHMDSALGLVLEAMAHGCRSSQSVMARLRVGTCIECLHGNAGTFTVVVTNHATHIQSATSQRDGIFATVCHLAIVTVSGGHRVSEWHVTCVAQTQHPRQTYHRDVKRMRQRGLLLNRCYLDSILHVESVVSTSLFHRGVQGAREDG